MTDIQQVLAFIDAMAADSSRTCKEEILAEMAATELGNWVLKWTYDPFVTFGVTVDLSNAEANAKNMGFHTNWNKAAVNGLLTDLARRDLTGYAAYDQIAIVADELGVCGIRLLQKILDKDLRCGINVATVNNVITNLIPVFSVMRAHKYDASKIKQWPVFGEPKLDGIRVTFVCREGTPGFFTRSGKRLPALDCLIPPVLKTAAAALANAYERSDLDMIKLLEKDSYVIDGEAMTGLFNSTGAVRRKNAQAEDAEFHVYDIMSWEDFDAIGSVGDDYDTRRRNLWTFCNHANTAAVQMVPNHVLLSDNDAMSLFDHYLNLPLATYLARGNVEREAELLKLLVDKNTGGPKMMEGVIVKKRDGLYDKKKTHGWMKLKAEETEDLPIVGAFAGKKGTKYEFQLGGLIVDRSGVEVRVGGGFSDKERAELWVLWLHDQDPELPPALVGRLIEVKFHEVTPDGSLRHPNFVRFRDDKAGEIESKEAA